MKTFQKALVLSALFAVVAAPAVHAYPGESWVKYVYDGFASVGASYKGDGKDDKGGILAAAKNPWAYGSALATAAAIGIAYLAYKKYFAKPDDGAKAL